MCFRAGLWQRNAAYRNLHNENRFPLDIQVLNITVIAVKDSKDRITIFCDPLKIDVVDLARVRQSVASARSWPIVKRLKSILVPQLSGASNRTSWRNGSAFDSRSKGWGFDSLRGHVFLQLYVFFYVFFPSSNFTKIFSDLLLSNAFLGCGRFVLEVFWTLHISVKNVMFYLTIIRQFKFTHVVHIVQKIWWIVLCQQVWNHVLFWIFSFFI